MPVSRLSALFLLGVLANPHIANTQQPSPNSSASNSPPRSLLRKLIQRCEDWLGRDQTQALASIEGPAEVPKQRRLQAPDGDTLRQASLPMPAPQTSVTEQNLRFPELGARVFSVPLGEGLEAEMMRPILYRGRAAGREGALLSPSDFQRRTLQSVDFATQHFKRRAWTEEFISGRPVTALDNLPESTYFTVRESKTSRILGTIRLMCHPYAVDRGVIINQWHFTPDEPYYKSSPGFRKKGEASSVGSIQPKLTTAMEDYLDVQLNRMTSELESLSLQNPATKFDRQICEIGNLAIDSTLDKKTHAQVWAQLWSLLINEMSKDLHQYSPMDLPIVTYGDDVSIRLYQSLGFLIDESIAPIEKDGVLWRVIRTTNGALLAHHQDLLKKGFRGLDGKSFEDAQSGLPRTVVGDYSYSHVQTLDRSLEEFLQTKDRPQQSTAFFAIFSRIKRLTVSRERNPDEIDKIRKAILAGLFSGDEFLRGFSANLLHFAEALSEFEDTVRSPQISAHVRAAAEHSIKQPAYPEKAKDSQLLHELLPIMRLDQNLDFDFLWNYFEFNQRELQESADGRETHQWNSKVLGQILYNTFRDGKDIQLAEALARKVEDFLSKLVEAEDYDFAIDSKVNIARQIRGNLLGWFPEIFGRLPKLSKDYAWLKTVHSEFAIEYYSKRDDIDQVRRLRGLE